MTEQTECEGTGTFEGTTEAIGAIAGEILKPCINRSIAVAAFSAGITALSVMACALLMVAWFLAVTIEKWQDVLQ